MTRPYKRRKIMFFKHSSGWREAKREYMRRYREKKRNQNPGNKKLGK